MPVRIAINGFGRIGRLTFRILMERKDEFEIVAINDLTKNEMLATLLKYDTVHGRFNGTVKATDTHLIVNGKEILALSERDPAKLPWGEEQGRHLYREHRHLYGSCCQRQTRLRYAPDRGRQESRSQCASQRRCGSDLRAGRQRRQTDRRSEVYLQRQLHNQCLAPVAKVLNDTFGIESGLMTTVHAYTNDQNVQDLPPRRSVSCSRSSSKHHSNVHGAASAVGLGYSRTEGQLTGIAMRVPVATGSVVDLTANLKKETTAAEINAAMKAAAEGPLKGILSYTKIRSLARTSSTTRTARSSPPISLKSWVTRASWPR